MFNEPEIKVITFAVEDVIATSGEVRDPDEGGDAPL